MSNSCDKISLTKNPFLDIIFMRRKLMCKLLYVCSSPELSLSSKKSNVPDPQSWEIWWFLHHCRCSQLVYILLKQGWDCL